jgi:hypothetical protein
MLNLSTKKIAEIFFNKICSGYKDVEGFDDFKSYFETEYFHQSDYLIWYMSSQIPSWVPFKNNNTEGFNRLLKKHYTSFYKMQLNELFSLLKNLIEEHLLLDSHDVMPYSIEPRVDRKIYKYLPKYLKPDIINYKDDKF